MMSCTTLTRQSKNAVRRHWSAGRVLTCSWRDSYRLMYEWLEAMPANRYARDEARQGSHGVIEARPNWSGKMCDWSNICIHVLDDKLGAFCLAAVSICSLWSGDSRYVRIKRGRNHPM
jgi:hypothetical protein